jgi:hypothetical protein
MGGSWCLASGFDGCTSHSDDGGALSILSISVGKEPITDMVFVTFQEDRLKSSFFHRLILARFDLSGPNFSP